jgi:hypothetical protein
VGAGLVGPRPGLSLAMRRPRPSLGKTLRFDAFELGIGALTGSNRAELGDELIRAGAFQAPNLVVARVGDMPEVEGRRDGALEDIPCQVLELIPTTRLPDLRRADGSEWMKSGSSAPGPDNVQPAFPSSPLS